MELFLISFKVDHDVDFFHQSINQINYLHLFKQIEKKINLNNLPSAPIPSFFETFKSILIINFSFMFIF